MRKVLASIAVLQCAHLHGVLHACAAGAPGPRACGWQQCTVHKLGGQALTPAYASTTDPAVGPPEGRQRHDTAHTYTRTS